MVSEGKGRGWNLRKGSKDYNVERLREHGRIGGKAKVPKGFSNPEVLRKAQETRGIIPKEA